MSTSPKPKMQSKLSEPEFLRRQAAEAKAGMNVALKQAKTALIEKADPLKIARRHPILVILSAAVSGFAAAAIAIPSKQEQELRRLERLHRAMHPEPTPPPTNGSSAGPAPAEKHSIWSTLLHEGIQLIKPILLATITAGIKSAANPPVPRAGDGQSPPNGPT